MLRVRLVEVENEKIQDLGQLLIKEGLVPLVGDKLYFKGVQQYNVVERQFNIMEQSLYDIELFIEKTKVL